MRMYLLAKNPGKRRTEQIYLIWFALTVPMQLLVTNNLSYDSPNDGKLLTQACIMGAGTLLLPLIFRVAEDKGKPLKDLYAFRMGLFLVVWAVLGGFTGTDPWYEVLKGHFAFNTEWNPNGVPGFMLPMTIAVFGAYTVILGTLYRLIVQLAEKSKGALARDSWWRHVSIIVVLAPLMPLVETLAYTSTTVVDMSNKYCFDPGPGKWGLNLLIYGSWHFAALLFYPRFDREPGERTPVVEVATKAFATLGVLVFMMALTKAEIAPHFTDVEHGVRFVNDWSEDNCLGPKPDSAPQIIEPSAGGNR